VHDQVRQGAGAKYVFVNDADKKVYVVDAQDKVAAHAGHHVTVKAPWMRYAQAEQRRYGAFAAK